jgi:transcriptional regulator with GAF, ATPase, and Fis domain
MKTAGLPGCWPPFATSPILLDLKIRAGRIQGFRNIIGQDIKMLQVFQQISDVAGLRLPGPHFGETGTGKELVATAIHNESHRGGGPFVPINCGALPEGLIESELFGHVKGAFSGAIRDKKGRFELADGGTIFLDEVAELSKHMQVKLLRFLQEGTFERVGGEKTISVNVRVISATNKDLKKEVQQGRFREDLYYRLNVIPHPCPPTAGAQERHPPAHRPLSGRSRGALRTKPSTDPIEALSLMMDYSWPGNVRELQNAIQFAIVKCNGHEITTPTCPWNWSKGPPPQPARAVPPASWTGDAVAAALEKTGGNKAKAARLLGVGRATLYRFSQQPGRSC